MTVLPPAAPVNLTAKVLDKSQVTLAWQDNANNETGFEIERCKGDKSNKCQTYTKIATVAANVTQYPDTSLKDDDKYTYRVRATNSAGNSAYSNAVSVKTKEKEKRK